MEFAVGSLTKEGLLDLHSLRTASGQPLLRVARVLRGIIKNKRKSLYHYNQTITYHFGNPTSFEQAARIILFWYDRR